MSDFEKPSFLSMNEAGALASDTALVAELRRGRGLPESACFSALCTALKQANAIGVESALRALRAVLARRADEALSTADAYPHDHRRCPDPAAAAAWSGYKQAIARRQWADGAAALDALERALAAHLPSASVHWR
ncbi:MAG: hypothetical protein IPJ65_36055 [Archangiaceae bacterium]|nr:hypothetical protein [Archangiaceae bacterium]